MLRRALFSTTRVLPAAARTRSAESFAVQTARRFLTSNGPSSIRTTATIGSMYARAFAATSFVVGSAVAVTAFAEEEGKSSESESFRAKMIGNYENRIRALSSPEKVFYYFASVSKNGHTYMNVDDFLDAITPYDRVAQNVSLNSNPNKGVDPKLKKGDGAAAASSSAGKEISEIFKLADTDGDGLISFSEYLFFVTLLSIPEKQFRIAFQMFDLDGNGSVDLAEFRQVVTMMSARTVQGQAQRTKSLKDMQKKQKYPQFFGENGKGRLTVDQFGTYVKKLQHALMVHEFNHFDNGNKGYLSPHDFALSLLSFARVKDIESYYKRAEDLKSVEAKISLEQYIRFSEMLKHVDDIDEAISLFVSAEGEISKVDLRRAARAVAGIRLSKAQIHALFHVFDADGSGTLDRKEFIDVLRQRFDRGLNRPRDIGVGRFFECLKNCGSKLFEE